MDNLADISEPRITPWRSKSLNYSTDVELTLWIISLNLGTLGCCKSCQIFPIGRECAHELCSV